MIAEDQGHLSKSHHMLIDYRPPLSCRQNIKINAEQTHSLWRLTLMFRHNILICQQLCTPNGSIVISQLVFNDTVKFIYYDHSTEGMLINIRTHNTIIDVIVCVSSWSLPSRMCSTTHIYVVTLAPRKKRLSPPHSSDMLPFIALVSMQIFKRHYSSDNWFRIYWAHPFIFQILDRGSCVGPPEEINYYQY